MARLFRFVAHPASLAALACLLLAALLSLHPTGALGASLRGLTIWWDVLFPALFPFFVMAELMLGFGIVHFFGALLDPLMRPIFRKSALFCKRLRNLWIRHSDSDSEAGLRSR